MLCRAVRAPACIFGFLAWRATWHEQQQLPTFSAPVSVCSNIVYRKTSLEANIQMVESSSRVFFKNSRWWTVYTAKPIASFSGKPDWNVEATDVSIDLRPMQELTFLQSWSLLVTSKRSSSKFCKGMCVVLFRMLQRTHFYIPKPIASI